MSDPLSINPFQKLNAEVKQVPMVTDEKANRTAQLKQQSNQLEAVFLTQLIKSMEKTIPEGLEGGKNTLSTMLFSSVMGDAMAQGGGIGLSRMIFNSLQQKKDQTMDPVDMGAEDYLQTLNVTQHLSMFEDQE